MNSKFYDGTRLRSKLDLDGKRPEMFLVSGNRTAGKTFDFKKFAIGEFKKGNGKFVILYRFINQCKGAAENFFRDLEQTVYPGEIMTEKAIAGGYFYELFLNGESCGYSIAINAASKIKEKSVIFSDANRILFDEFQAEDGRYCTDEINKFISIHTSIARGQGQQHRYVPVYMTSNNVTILNPYYEALGIGYRLQHNTKFLRGNGWVFENCWNENAANALADSGIGRAFANTAYMQYARENTYLNDSKNFIEKMTGKNRYICSVYWNNYCYAIREFPDTGIIYCDDRGDELFYMKFSLLTEDHEPDRILLRPNNVMISDLRQKFQYGMFRFKNLQCKRMILHLLSWDTIK